MTEHALPTLGEIDRDEALLEAVAELHGDTRADFLRKAAIGSGAMLAILGAPATAAAANRLSDTDILKFGLRFERLQASFYTEADSTGTVKRMSGRLARNLASTGGSSNAAKSPGTPTRSGWLPRLGTAISTIWSLSESIRRA